jgi:hypothetical protein
MKALSLPVRPSLIFAVVAAVVFPSASGAQTADTLRGRVTTDSGAAITGAEVVATRAPDRAFKSTLTDKDGRYQIVFEGGTGDYLLHVAALGRTAVRVRVKRDAQETLLTQDVQLKSSIQQLETVTISAKKEKPVREDFRAPEPGESGKLEDGVYGSVPPDAKGNLAAIAATAPGVSLTPGGISVLGLDPSQNRTTLNGMAFAGADVPRAARINSRVSSSSYDPARGWFGGAEIRTELTPGFLFTQTNLAFVVDAPALQYADRISTASGQKFTNLIGSLGHSGLFAKDKFNYSFAFEGGHRSSPYTSLERAGTDLLQHSGLSRDSAARLLGLLSIAGLPDGRSTSAIGHNSDYLEFIGRIDRPTYNYNTFEPEKQSWGLLGYAKVGHNSALGIGPTAPAMHGGESTQEITSAQAVYSTYLHDRDYLTEARTAINVKQDRTSPYLGIPSGNVLVTSDFPGLMGAVTPVSFGGNSSLNSNTREWIWETNSTTSFYASSRTHHRVQLTADSRLDGFAQSSPGNGSGTFSYNSLADLAANKPSVFTRTLNAPSTSVREWNAFASLGDYWRKSKTVQVLYGARLEGNRFLDRPPNNPDVERLFGTRTDQAPAGIHVSPRVGFTWIRVPAGQGFTYNGLGMFNIGPPSYLRGGFGEFRSMLQPSLLSQAMAPNGLPGGATYLTCIGAAVPAPDWVSYQVDPETIPTQCAAGSGIPATFADVTPSVVLFDRAYQPPRSWRGNLSYASTFHSLLYSIEGIYSVNLNQPGRTDLNFNGVPRFLASGEGRPVYAGVVGIDPASGFASTVDARKTSLFGPVLLHRSDLRSISRQATLIVSPPPENARRWFGSVAYTLSSVRALASGFDAPTFDSPLRREWSRGDFDARHQFVIQAGVLAKGISLTLFGRINSGLPFTPVVGSDVNGDGLANDRAFIFKPGTGADSALDQGLAALVAGSPKRVQNCLTSQYGSPARRNSCEAPWTATVNMQLTKNFEIPNLKGRYANIALAIANPLGGIDQLLHGSAHLRGWGLPALPDPRLYSVRGFDSLAHRFQYEVNPRFGNTRPANSVVRAPFRLELDVSLNIGPPLSLQQLERWIGAGRSRPGPKLTVDDLKKKYRRNVPDPYTAILEESDSLLLSAEQEKALQAAQAEYVRGIDSLWTPLTEYLAGLGNQFDSKEALRRQEETIDAVWEYSRLNSQKTFGTILSPVQINLLPWLPKMLYNAKKALRIRMFMG